MIREFYKMFREHSGYFLTQRLMVNLKITVVLVTLFYAFCMPALATGIHKWVDEHGVTHYSDKAPDAKVGQVAVIEVSSTYSTATSTQQDYYSITNQWMRLHQERLEREKIKLEKAKQKAALQPSTPQVVYVNEPNKERYTVAYPFFVHNKFNRHRRLHRSNKEYGDRPSFRRREFCPATDFNARRFRGLRSNRNTSGLTLRIH